MWFINNAPGSHTGACHQGIETWRYDRETLATVSAVNGTDVAEILDLDQLLALMVLAIGAAMILGNGFAVWQHHRGKKPEGEEGEFRAGRAYWLLAIGLIMTIWGLASL